MLEPIEDVGGAAQPLLEVKGLLKHFPVGGGLFAKKKVVQAVDDVSFAVAKGETVGIVGESGCGKSTTARLLMQLMPRNAGEIIFDGQLVGEAMSLRDLRRAMQMVFQDSYASLNPRLTIEESIAFGPKVHGMADGEARTLARDLLTKVGLKPETFANRYPHEVSGGQRQRVALARALVHAPKLLLLDEPLGALDALTRIDMQALIESLWTRHRFTALLVTHDVAEAVALADRVLLIEDGWLALDLRVDLPRPRRRDAAFAALEQRLLDRVLSTPGREPEPAHEPAPLSVAAPMLRWAV